MSANLENSAVATGLEKVSFHSNPKEGQCQTMFSIVQVCSFHMLVKLCSKSFKLGFSSTWPKNFQMYKLGFEEAKEPEIKLPTFAGSQKKKGIPEKHLLQHHWLCCGIFREMGVPDHLTVSWETCMQAKKQQNQTWNNWMLQSWEKSTTRLYIVTLLI